MERRISHSGQWHSRKTSLEGGDNTDNNTVTWSSRVHESSKFNMSTSEVEMPR